MSTNAQFKVGEVVWYWDGDLKKNLAIIVEVANENPAQYHVAMTSDSSVTTCGEGVDEPGAVSAL
jgi:hypothetical protein